MWLLIDFILNLLINMIIIFPVFAIAKELFPVPYFLLLYVIKYYFLVLIIQYFLFIKEKMKLPFLIWKAAIL